MLASCGLCFEFNPFITAFSGSERTVLMHCAARCILRGGSALVSMRISALCALLMASMKDIDRHINHELYWPKQTDEVNEKRVNPLAGSLICLQQGTIGTLVLDAYRPLRLVL